MESLVKIVQCLTHNKMREIDVIDNKDSNSRFTQFYRLIKSGEIATDAEAEAYFYGDASNKSNSTYRSFKSQFRQRLLNTMYFIDTENPLFSDFQKTYYSVQHEWGAILLLYRRNISTVATEYSEKLLTTCIKYEFTDISVALLEKLKSMSVILTLDKKKHDAYRKQFWHYKAILDAELIAQDAFEDIRLDYTLNKETKKKTNEVALKKLMELEVLRKNCESFMFMFHYFTVKSAVYSIQNDWQNVISVSDEAVAVFLSKPFNMKGYISTFLGQKVVAYLMLHEYEACQLTLEKSLTLLEEGSFNWIKAQEKKTFLLFHTQNYVEAFHNFQYISNFKEMKNLKGINAEIWQLFEAYLYLLMVLGKLPNIDKKAFKNFKMSKFLNEIPVFSADKKGMNIPVLIAQICLLIAEKKYSKLVDYIEAIEKYMVRNVPKKEANNYRANQFIKVLLEIPKSNINPIALKRKTEKMMHDLTQVSSDIAIGYKSEIIPYEILWAELLSSF
jgi:hypothetical protein